ncbi:aspartyl-phosphate phosphatase Spo0E family protein [Paenibacillus elgii]|uniref:aspartyl-phosphate phosphatase Spo0E family protein n=1 Tax=Paenibacillus elgii TaxID=189691 RepID=UPI0009EE5995|nr:aspartyl-phosphate phosphatase Spo0E family protein [Paenibacillus elgii]
MGGDDKRDPAELIEIVRLELRKLAESKGFNFLDPEVIRKSEELDQLLNAFKQNLSK